MMAGAKAPIEGVTVHLDDAEGLKGDAESDQRQSFGGTPVIHPERVAPVAAVCAPCVGKLG